MKKVLIAAGAALVMVFIYNQFSCAKIVNNGNNGAAIVCFGDSLTRGHGATAGNSYPDLLAQKTSRPVINLGVNGNTAPQGFARISEVAQHNPYMVIIEFGGNDFMKQVPASQSAQAVSDMVDYVHSLGAIAVVVETGGNFMMGKYGKEYKKIAKQKGAVFVPAIMEDILDNPKLKSDQIHPNNEGYKIVADRIFKRIEKYL